MLIRYRILCWSDDPCYWYKAIGEVSAELGDGKDRYRRQKWMQMVSQSDYGLINKR